jgi:phosphomannomutase
MYKVIIFDIDGTLAVSKQAMTREMAEAIKKLADKIPVGIMSGGALPQFENQFLLHLPIDINFSNIFLFPTSAAECLSFKDGKWEREYDYLFKEDQKQKIKSAIQTVLNTTGFLNEGDQSFGDRLEDRGEQMTWSALGQQAPIELKEEWDPDHKKRELLRAELLKLIPEFEIKIGGTTSIDITRKDISKEDGVLWLAKHFKIDASEMLYVGDALFSGGNDAEVLKTSVQTKQVSGPEETLKVIEGILA